MQAVRYCSFQGSQRSHVTDVGEIMMKRVALFVKHSAIIVVKVDTLLVCADPNPEFDQ